MTSYLFKLVQSDENFRVVCNSFSGEPAASHNRFTFGRFHSPHIQPTHPSLIISSSGIPRANVLMERYSWFIAFFISLVFLPVTSIQIILQKHLSAYFSVFKFNFVDCFGKLYNQDGRSAQIHRLLVTIFNLLARIIKICIYKMIKAIYYETKDFYTLTICVYF